MKVRGSIISNINDYVQHAHAGSYSQWIDALPEASQDLMKKPKSSEWYPLSEGMLEPTRIMCEMFYASAKEGAWKSGRYSAEVGLTGIYKVFVLVSSPNFLIKRASRILATFYDPTHVEVVDSSDKSMLVHFTELPARSEYLEYRIAGWIEKALEICGCKNLSMDTSKSIANGDNLFELKISWS